MLELTMEAFRLTFKYRNPVVILGDGYLGQITGKVTLPNKMIQPGIPQWAVYGDAYHRRNLISSIYLAETDLSDHNKHLNAKYAEMTRNEQRAEEFYCEDAETLIVACNTPAQMARGAIETLRRQGIKAGLYRPITLWPFPVQKLLPRLKQLKSILVVEASDGQLENEMRLALSHQNVGQLPHIDHLRSYGGMLPQQHDVVEKVVSLQNQKITHWN
jgi:pyruvate/2-oxoacid:ferredoxin oxidoreductase alpha subunit